MHSFCSAGISALILLILPVAGAAAATRDRITGPINPQHTRVLKGGVHRLASPQFDQGAADISMRLGYVMLMTRPSAAQQADLDRLLAEQQNPSSPHFHKWLTPEEFANRFGLSTGDHSRIAAWLQSEGFTIKEQARGRNWIAFSGTAEQVAKSLHTSIHRYLVNGEKHFANSSDPSVPEAIGDVVAGFVGLDDFRPVSNARLVPDFNSNTGHFLVPEDFATIYNLAPLYQAGLDGSGVGIAIVGESDIQLSDLQAFRKRYNLPAKDPKKVLYDPLANPGINPNIIEADLDLEWAGALAPQANLTYVYGDNAFQAFVYAVARNYAPIVSISFSACEVEYDTLEYRAIAQQANAQGITILAASGDAGAAGCDRSGQSLFASRGQTVSFPAILPEVTAVGGTQFVEGSGTYWDTKNSPNLGSALGYIPETAWNESSQTSGIAATGGGTSVLYSRPSWQTGPGVPSDNARHIPDVSLSAAFHDGYYINFLGLNGPVSGTSAGTPSMAGILALLNQYLVTNQIQTTPGLGNINPQLYRLAQSTPAAFHDVKSGSNMVLCSQGSPDCLSGSFGYKATDGYDMATGLGSVDANALVTAWNTAVNGVTVTLSAANSKVTSNDTITLTATVTAASGAGTPTGTVDFSAAGFPVGSAPLAADGTATLTFPAYTLGPGNSAYSFIAQYSGDAAFSSGGASTKVTISTPHGVASIIPLTPGSIQGAGVWASGPDSRGLLWQTFLELDEVAGVGAMLTGFTMDGQSLPVSDTFKKTDILPGGFITGSITLRNQQTPATHVFGFSGVDASGQSWSVAAPVTYYGLPAFSNINASFTAAPLTVVQDTTADPSCQWPVRMHLDEIGGFSGTILGMLGGNNVLTELITGSGASDLSDQVIPAFGTSRLSPYGSLSGTLCFGGITPPATETILVEIDSNFAQQMTVSFVGPPANPVSLTADPANLTMDVSAPATLSLNLSDPAQPWTASVFPANRTTSWLTLSQTSGAGPAQITLSANAAGFEPGAYRAAVVLQCPNALPQTVTVPVMFLVGASTSGTAISGVIDPVSGQTTGAPGMLIAVQGSQLANTVQKGPSTSPQPYTIAGVSAAVNGIAAPVVSVSPAQLLIQIPYEVGSGPAVLGINNNGQVAGFQFQVAASAPGIYADAQGNLQPRSSARRGAGATLLINGAGDTTIANPIVTGFWPASSGSTRPVPALPISVTVGGVPAFLQSYSIASGALGETQVQFTVPSSIDPGVQPVVVTVGGVSSQPVNLTVQ